MDNEEKLEETKEFDNLTSIEEINEEENIFTPPIQKLSLIDKFKSLNPKIKVLFIVVFLVLILLVLFLVFFLGKDEEVDNSEKVDEEKNIVIEKDNYIYDNGQLSILEDDNVVGVYDCINKSEESCYVAYLDSTTLLDKAKYVKEDDVEIKIPSKVYNKHVFIFDNVDGENYIKLVSLNSGEIINSYLSVRTIVIDDEIYLIMQDENELYNLYSLLDFEKIFSEDYDFIDHMDDESNVVVYNDDIASILDIKGEVLTSNIKGDVKDYNDKYIALFSFNNYSIIDYESEVIKNTLDYASLNNSYYSYTNAGKLYLANYDGIKYLEDGIDLLINDLSIKYVFNSTNELIKEEYSYKTSISNNEITVIVLGVDDEIEYVINTIEGDVSKDLSYHSYYGGILYIYGDEEKEQLLGSYSCKNKNTLGDKKLDKCYPAIDSKTDISYDYIDSSTTDYIMPIINNKFVFIQDGEKIAVYNLELEKNESYVYEVVNLVTKDNYPSLRPITVNNIDVIATNSDLKYGVINISQSINSVHTFNNNYISRLNTGYALQKGDEWEFVNDNNERYDGFKGVIKHQEDSYLIVEDNDEDFVYDLSGNKITNQGFEFVSISSQYQYIAGIKKNKLYVYELNGKETLTFGVSIDVDLSSGNPIEFINTNIISISETNGFDNEILIVKGSTNGS